MEQAVTRTEFFESMALINAKLERLSRTKPRFISRSQIIAEMGRPFYEEGVRAGHLKPIKGPGKNSKVLIESVDYENYILFLKR